MTDAISREAALEAIYGDPDGWTRDAIRALPALDLIPQPAPDVARLVEAAKALRDDMLQRAEARIDRISGEQYRVVNAGNTAWTGFCAALAAMEGKL